MANLYPKINGLLKPRNLIWLKTSLLLSLFIVSCKDSSSDRYKKTTISGNAQGTTYNIIICGNHSIKKREIDSILNNIDFVLSNYNDQSTISGINKCKTDSLFIKKNGYFSDCFTESIEINQNTNGAFDPSIHPFVRSWGLFNLMFNESINIFISFLDCSLLTILAVFS